MANVSSLLLGAAFLLAAAVYLRQYEAGGNAAAAAAATTTTTTTHLHFFMHDDYTGPRPTAARVVSGRSLLPSPSSDGVNDDSDTDGSTPPSLLLTSPRQFGDIVALNNALTEGPSSDSARVGKAQGFAVRVSEGGVVSSLLMHLVFEAGEHRGSSVTVSGRIDVDEKVRESVIVGGTGRFRFARGYLRILSRSYDYDLARGGIVEMDVYVQH